jgi:hypothetical protein
LAALYASSIETKADFSTGGAASLPGQSSINGTEKGFNLQLLQTPPTPRESRNINMTLLDSF